MVKIIISILLIVHLLFLVSCVGTRAKSFDSFDGAFFCEYSYEISGKHFRVSLESDKGSGDDGRIEVLFREPETLAGIKCVSKNGKTVAGFGDMSVTGESAAALLLPSSLFFYDGEAVYCGILEIDGRELERFKLREGVYVYIDGESELPVMLSGEAEGTLYELRIISFAKLGG